MKDKKFLYISPLKDCDNEYALQMAKLIENSMLESVNLLIDFTECRVKQIYEYADKLMKEELTK